MLIWISDIFNIVFNSFKYRIQKEKFIFSMNVQTRAKLGEKYIDLELYKKPWWFRFKVWCQKKKRGYEEWKHDRRQRLIEKEKAKIAKREEKDKIEAEIAHHEELEEAEIKKQKRKDNIENIIDKSALDEVKALDDGKKEETEAKQTKVSKPKTAKAKFSNKTSSKKNTKNTSNKNK